MAQRYFAISNPGLEAPLLAEVRRLGGRKATILHGGVEFEGTNAVFYRMNYRLRTAQRVVLRVDSFRARDAVELYNKTRRFEWERLIDFRSRVYVRASAKQSRLIHTGRIAKSVEDAIVDRFNDELEAAPPTIATELKGANQLLLARIEEDRCTLSLDGSGQLLYRRGWRTRIGQAPIRETIAAALLELAGWTPGMPVYDPTCGSGTFPIEAAQIASGIAAGRSRKFAIFHWANFNRETWQKVIDEAAHEEQLADAYFFGSDTDEKVLEAARANAERADVSAIVRFEASDAAEMVPPCATPGLVICNPPYGLRLHEGGTIGQIVRRFAERFEGWRLAMLIPEDVELPKTGVEFEERARFRNGGVAVRFVVSRDAAVAEPEA